MISATLGVPAAAAAIIAARYPLTAFSSPSVALGAVGTDAIFACPGLAIDQPMESLIPPVPQIETNFASTHNCAFWTALEAAAT
jgi:hypothetical protein